MTTDTATLEPPATAPNEAEQVSARRSDTVEAVVVSIVDGRRDMRAAITAVIRARLAANPVLNTRDAGAVVADLVAEFPAHRPQKKIAP